MTSLKDQNYYSTFIEVADDCPVSTAEVPRQKGNEPTVSLLQYEMIRKHPYACTQEDVLFGVYAIRNGIVKKDLKNERDKFFSRGQPCLRSSSLGKRYGWGMHCNKQGKIALVAMESPEYANFAKDQSILHIKAMRSKRSK
jgi:hypothetical protein